MQVKKARTESARKPIVPPSQSSLPENITVRTQSKTKVSTGSRRNNIIGYVPRVARQEVVAPPLTNILTGNPNNGAATLPLIDDDVITCFNGGLPILDLQSGRTSDKKLNGVENKNGKNASLKSSSLQQPTFNKNGLPSLQSSTTTTTTTVPSVSTTHSRQPNEKSSFNLLSTKKDKSNELSKSKSKDNKKKFDQKNDYTHSISSSKKEKKSSQENNSNFSGLPNLIDDEFGFGRSLLSESSDDEAEDDESCKPQISYNEFGLPILTSKNNGNYNNNKNSGSSAFNNPETNYNNNNNNIKNSFELGSSTSMMNNGYTNNKNYTSQIKPAYNAKEKIFSNVKNNNNYNNSNININSNVKHEPVITKESNFRNELNFNKETFTAQKRQLNKFPTQDQELPTKIKKKEDLSHKNTYSENPNEIKKDKKNKKDKKDKKDRKLEKEKKNKSSNDGLGKQQHSSSLNLHKMNIQNTEILSKSNKSSLLQDLNEKSRTNFSNPDSLNLLSNNPKISENNVSNNVNKSLPDLTIVIDDDDDDYDEDKSYSHYNHNNIANNETMKSRSFNSNNGRELVGLPDLSCAINNEFINQQSVNDSIYGNESNNNSNKKLKNSTKEKKDKKKHLNAFTPSSSSPPSILPKQATTSMNYDINSINQNNLQEFEKTKSKLQKCQPSYQQYNNYNQQVYYESQSLQQQYNCPQDYKENFVNIFNGENSSNLTENHNYIKETFNLNEKIENHFNTESNSGYYNKLNLNKDTNRYIGLEAIKSDDHLNSRGTSESEVGILSSSDSTSSDSDSSSSDSDSDDESRKRHSTKNKKSYQNANFQQQQQQQDQYDMNNFQSTSYNNNNNSNNYKYQQLYNRNGYNNNSNSNVNNVAFLHNDLKLSESDSSDSEL